ncbi:MAG: ABC transporter permease [Rhizobiaceae bacterium]|nr:ABC transporter permease [Rhizobiaceae bacterium]
MALQAVDLKRSRWAGVFIGFDGVHRALTVLRSLLAAMLLWWLVGILAGNPLLLPSPFTVLDNWWRLLVSGQLLEETLVSLQRLAIAYTFAAIVGIPVGFAMANWRIVDLTVGFVVNSIRPISGIAWIPIAIVWFGVGEELPIFIIFYGAVFPFILNAHASLLDIDKRLILVARTLGAGRVRIFLTVVLPFSIPYVLTGARIALGLAWMSIIAAELLGAPNGLGFSIQYMRLVQQTPAMLAWIFWVGVVGYALDALLRLAVQTLAPWSEAGRLGGKAR